MIPTPGQIEQEYLAEYHNSKNTFYCVPQSKLNLRDAVKHTHETTGITRICDVNQSVEKAIDVIVNN